MTFALFLLLQHGLNDGGVVFEKLVRNTKTVLLKLESNVYLLPFVGRIILSPKSKNGQLVQVILLHGHEQTF